MPLKSIFQGLQTAFDSFTILGRPVQPPPQVPLWTEIPGEAPPPTVPLRPARDVEPTTAFIDLADKVESDPEFARATFGKRKTPPTPGTLSKFSRHPLCERTECREAKVCARVGRCDVPRIGGVDMVTRICSAEEIEMLETARAIRARGGQPVVVDWTLV